MLTLFMLAAAANPGDSDTHIARMAALYEEVCLNRFPDDRAVITHMTQQGARELSAEEVQVTMRDDPARGWQLPDKSATVWIEFPPYHACSVRWSGPASIDLQAYQAVVERYKARVGGFQPVRAMEAEQGDIKIHAIGEQRPLPDQGAETLFVISQSITDPKRRAAGETGIVLRFVHQFAPPPPASGP